MLGGKLSGIRLRYVPYCPIACVVSRFSNLLSSLNTPSWTKHYPFSVVKRMPRLSIKALLDGKCEKIRQKKKKKNKRVTIIIWHEKGQVRQEKGCCLIASTYHSIKWQLDQPYVAQSKSPRGWTRSFCVSRFLTDRVIGRHWFFTCRAKMGTSRNVNVRSLRIDCFSNISGSWCIDLLSTFFLFFNQMPPSSPLLEWKSSFKFD